MERKIKQEFTSYRTRAGVSLVRGVGNPALDAHAPVLIFSITSKG